MLILSVLILKVLVHTEYGHSTVTKFIGWHLGPKVLALRGKVSNSELVRTFPS